MQKTDLSKLNKVQLEALMHNEGAVLVTAGAGSGKTRLLTYKVAYLINDLNTNPYNILAITFTNKAAQEMKDRIIDLVSCSNGITICTFHSLCVRVLRRYIDRLQGYNGNFTIYDDSDQDKVLKKVYHTLNIDTKDDSTKEIKWHISNIKNNDYDVLQYREMFRYQNNIDTILQIYQKYQNELLENNALDFDDLLIKTQSLLRENADIREYYQNKFKYIFVDEFQDTNVIQYNIVKLLCCPNPNIFVVGDEDQCIYTWRGANFKNIFNFKQDFKDVQLFKLEQNYRSTQKILNVANKIIKNNKERLDKTLFTENEQGEDVKTKELYDEKEEADFVAMQIAKLISSGEYQYKDIAVLSRLNALSFAFEERFLSYNIPYRIFGGFKFYDRAEIKNILAYLALLINPNDEVSFIRVINFPKRGIGQAAINSLRECASVEKLSLFDMSCKLSENPLTTGPLAKFASFGRIYKNIKNEIANLSLSQLVKKLISAFDIRSAYNSGKEEDVDKLLNIDTFIASTEEYEKNNPNSTLVDYLESVALVSDIDGMVDAENCVKIATVHSVKGLEFKVVFVVGCEEKIFPISRAIESQDIEEERRLMYVAITRAERLLYLTRAKTRFLYGKRDYMLPSRFLNELEIEKRPSMHKCETNYKSMHRSNFEQGASKTQNNFVNLARMNNFTPQEKTIINKDITMFKANQSVNHARFGNGKILSVDLNDKTADIEFEGFGKKTLILELAPLTIIKE